MQLPSFPEVCAQLSLRYEVIRAQFERLGF
jgi:hypothetical protein